MKKYILLYLTYDNPSFYPRPTQEKEEYKTNEDAKKRIAELEDRGGGFDFQITEEEEYQPVPSYIKHGVNFLNSLPAKKEEK